MYERLRCCVAQPDIHFSETGSCTLTSKCSSVSKTQYPAEVSKALYRRCGFEKLVHVRACAQLAGLHRSRHHLLCVACMDILRSSALRRFIVSRLVGCRWAAATTVTAAPAHVMRCSRNPPVSGSNLALRLPEVARARGWGVEYFEKIQGWEDETVL